MSSSFLRGHLSFCTLFMWEEASQWISQEQVVGGLIKNSAVGRRPPLWWWGGTEAECVPFSELSLALSPQLQFSLPGFSEIFQLQVSFFHSLYSLRCEGNSLDYERSSLLPL